ncbi:MAG: prolipoprotein diacylglyceryl transferase family protein [Anaerolineaceae bacterium]|nr:prolipoprotein diacylglyceryl transferase family protein [Anaerolineaceae bacterium]
MLNGFSLLVGLGASLGLWQVTRRAPPDTALVRVHAGLIVLAGSLAGSRLGFVMLHAAYYRSQPLEILQVGLDGLSWVGALAGGLLAILALSRCRHTPFAELADNLAPLVAPLAVFTWLGCWQAGTAYGATVPAGTLWSVPVRGEDGIFNDHLPLQLLAALSALVYFCWLEWKASIRSIAGWRASLTGVGLAANLLLFSSLRVDPAPTIAGVRLEVWAALVLMIAALAALRSIWKSTGTKPCQQPCD